MRTFFYPSSRGLAAGSRFWNLVFIGMMAVAYQPVAQEISISDMQTRAIIEKRKALVDVVSDEKLRQLFPLPQDKTALVGECLQSEADADKRQCLETVAQGFFEGKFTEEGRGVCTLLKGAVWGEQYAQHCLCYQAKNFPAIDQCLTKENKKIAALIKDEEKKYLMERLLAPLKMPPPKKPLVLAHKKQETSTPPVAPNQPQSTAASPAGDLGGEILGEPISVAATTQPDPAATAVLTSFLGTMKDKKNFELFTPESYAFHLFANVQFAKREKITEGLKGAHAQTVDANTIKLFPAEPQGTHNYLAKLDNEWYLDSVRASVEQKTAVGAPPVAELDGFLKQKETLMPLVGKAIQLCKSFQKDLFAQEKEECPRQLMEWVGPAFLSKPDSAKDLEVVLDYAGAALAATNFDAQTVITEKAFQGLSEAEKADFSKVQKNPLQFLQKALDGIKAIQKKDDNTYVIAETPQIRSSLVRVNNQWLLDREKL